MQDEPQYWRLRVTGIMCAAILGLCSWTLRGYSLAVKKVFDDFGTEPSIPGWFVSHVVAWLIAPLLIALAVVVFLLAKPRSSVRDLVVGWCLLTGVAVILAVTQALFGPGILRLIDDLS